MGRGEDRLHRSARPAGVPARPGDRHRSPFLQGSAGCVGGDGIVLTCEEPCFQSAMTRSPSGGKAARKGQALCGSSDGDPGEVEPCPGDDMWPSDTHRLEAGPPARRLDSTAPRLSARTEEVSRTGEVSETNDTSLAKPEP